MPQDAPVVDLSERDVWATFQVPYVPVNHTGHDSYLSLHDRLFPAVVQIAGVHHATHVTAGHVAFVRSRFVTLAALAMPAHALRAVGVEGVCAAIAADLVVPDDAIDCFSNGTAAVPAGHAVDAHGGNTNWTAIAFAVHGLTSESRFAGLVAKISPEKRTHELHFQTVAAMCGADAPALLYQDHHAFLTYAVDVGGDRGEANFVIGAFASQEASEFAANVLRVPEISIRDVVFKMAPRFVPFGDQDAPLDMWVKPGQEATPPPAPNAPTAPPNPPVPFVAPMGALREVIVTFAAPTDAVSSAGDTLEDQPLSLKQNAVVRAFADAVDSETNSAVFKNGFINENNDVELVSLSFQFTGFVDIAGVEWDDLLEIDALCDAVAFDLGADADLSRCHVEDVEDIEPAEEADGARTQKRLVFQTSGIPDRRMLDVMSVASAFPIATAVVGGEGQKKRVTLENRKSRATLTLGVWTTSQQVATSVRAALVGDAAMHALSNTLGGEVEVREVFIDQRPGEEDGDDTDKSNTGLIAHTRPVASLGRAKANTSKKSKKSKRHSETSREIWTTVQVPLLGGKDPHVLANGLTQSLVDAVRGVNEHHGATNHKSENGRKEDTSDSDEKPQLAKYVGASYQVVASLTVPGFPLRVDGPAASLGLGADLLNTGIVSLDLACRAIAVDLGVPQTAASCRFDGTGKLGHPESFGAGVVPYNKEAALGRSHHEESHEESHKESQASREESSHKASHKASRVESPSHRTPPNLGQTVLVLLDLGSDLPRARAAVEKARPTRVGAFATVNALIGKPGLSSDASFGATLGGHDSYQMEPEQFHTTASFARVDAFFAYTLPVSDSASALVTRHALATKSVDEAVSRKANARAVVRAADSKPKPSDLAALDLAPVGGEGLKTFQVFKGEIDSTLDASVFMRDTPPKFERDDPSAKKGEKSGLGGIAKFDETLVEQSTNDARLALRQAKARTAKAQLLRLHAMSPRLADLGHGRVVERRGVGRGFGFETAAAAVGIAALAAAALAAAAKRKAAASAAEVCERQPLVPKNEGEIAGAV